MAITTNSNNQNLYNSSTPTLQYIDQLKNIGFKLSKRESECLYYLLKGSSAKQIALKLNLSYRTIETYVSHLKDKFNCRTRIELVCKINDLYPSFKMLTVL